MIVLNGGNSTEWCKAEHTSQVCSLKFAKTKDASFVAAAKASNCLRQALQASAAL